MLRPLLTRSMTYDRDYALAAAQSMPHIDLEVYFDFDSAQITPEAEGQLRELGKALADPGVQDGLKKMAVKPGGPTGDAFKKRIDDDIKTFAEVVNAANLTFK